MSVPTLTPSSQTSAIILPSTGSTSDVADVLPIGVYSLSTDFLSGAAAQVAYTYKKLGGDILDIEIKAANVYANYEEACLEYSYLVNIHQSKNSLGSILGNTTGSFSHTGQFSGSASGSAANKNANLKFPKMRFEMVERAGDWFSNKANVGGTEPIYSASFDSVADKQDYDLQSLISTAAADSDNSAFPYYGKVGDKRIRVRQVYYVSPRQMWRFYGYYGGLNVTGDLNNYGQYADDSNFQVVPVWQNKIQAIQYEDHLYTRTSHYSFEIIDNKLRLYPIPSAVSPEKFWVKFSVKTDALENDGDEDEGLNGVNNMSNLPFENVPFNSINSIGKQWIRRFALALSKETLGQVRGKFGGAVPIPGDSVTLNAADLLSQAKEEQNALRDELKTILDEMTYEKLTEKDSAMTENMNKVQEKIPLAVFVG